MKNFTLNPGQKKLLVIHGSNGPRNPEPDHEFLDAHGNLHHNFKICLSGRIVWAGSRNMERFKSRAYRE